MFQMGMIIQLTLSWFNVLRSACTLNHLTDCRLVSKLYQFVTVQCSVMINNNLPSMTHHKTHQSFRGTSYKLLLRGQAATGFLNNRMP